MLRKKLLSLVQLVTLLAYYSYVRVKTIIHTHTQEADNQGRLLKANAQGKFMLLSLSSPGIPRRCQACCSQSHEFLASKKIALFDVIRRGYLCSVYIFTSYKQSVSSVLFLGDWGTDKRGPSGPAQREYGRSDFGYRFRPYDEVQPGQLTSTENDGVKLVVSTIIAIGFMFDI